MNKAGFRNWVEQNKQEDEQVLWAGSPRMVYFRGLFFTRVIPGLVLLGLAGGSTWAHRVYPCRNGRCS